jgi:uncharacterized protein (DUF927 family)
LFGLLKPQQQQQAGYIKIREWQFMDELFFSRDLTMLDEKRRQAGSTANNHRDAQNPAAAKVAETRPQKHVRGQLASTGEEEVENFVSTFSRAQQNGCGVLWVFYVCVCM